jgi:hypothetical protein
MSSSYSYLGFFLVADVVVVVPLAFDQLIRQHISLFNSDNETRSFDILFLWAFVWNPFPSRSQGIGKTLPYSFSFPPSLHYKVYTKATTRLLVVVVDGTSVHSEHTAHDS